MAEDAIAINIPAQPAPGELWFSINLGLVDDVPQVYRTVESLGFKPVLAIKQIGGETEVHLLLAHRTGLEMPQPDHSLYEYEQHVLADAINPDAIRFSCGLTRPLTAA